MDPELLSIVALVVLGGLLLCCVAALLLSEQRQRRRGRAAADARARYHQQQAQPARPVTVAELLTRATDEGWALRLNWEPDDEQPDEAWPTGILPRIRDEDLDG